jgi:hypothetical protein
MVNNHPAIVEVFEQLIISALSSKFFSFLGMKNLMHIFTCCPILWFYSQAGGSAVIYCCWRSRSYDYIAYELELISLHADCPAES